MIYNKNSKEYKHSTCKTYCLTGVLSLHAPLFAVVVFPKWQSLLILHFLPYSH